jgi:CSLREA domain-containing protein
VLARRPLAIAVALLALGMLGVLAPAAFAVTYEVNSKGDEPDAAVGTNGCKTAANVCSLRAAIQESNNSTGTLDLIGFDGTIFNGKPGAAITLGSVLPSITDGAFINGSSCVTDVNSLSGPCVEVKASSTSTSVLTLDSADNSLINGLSLVGGQTGINVLNSSQSLTVTQNWIGVKLDGSAGGNLLAGIFIDPNSNNAVIGGLDAGSRNVISNNGIGLDILGADNATIRGNFFGVTPNGQAAAVNTIKDIEITDSTAAGDFKAQNNEIGVALPKAEVLTTDCDKGCNVISGSTFGIDLNGDGSAIQEEAPATGPTAIDSNYIGLKSDGLSGAIPNTLYGIMVGAAEGVSIGGSPAQTAFTSTNVITGGEYGIFAAEAEALQVFNNIIGGSVLGAQVTPPSAAGIFSYGLGVIEQAAIQSNIVRMVGGVGIEQRFTGSLISGNTITGGAFGIRTVVSGGEGSLIKANNIQGASTNAILIEDDGNEAVGNFITKSGAAGIKVQTPGDDGLLPSTGNLIGGPSSDENSIYESGGPAIEISNLEDSDNEIAANNGEGNAGPFIDLVKANPGEANHPNHGIPPPTISSATLTTISGTALPGAKVLVFRKATAAAGELNSFIGKATAGGAGAWSLAYEDKNEDPLTLPAGTNVAALQTSTSGGSSELALTTAQAPKPEEKGTGGGGSGGGGGGSTNSADKAPPQTKITKGPKGKSSSTVAKFTFTSTEAGSTFQCKLDGKPFKTCRSPKKYKGLKAGKHVFKVRATDAARNVDPSPAVKKFTVLGPKP